MNKEIISDRKALSIYIIFLSGTAIIYTRGIQAKHDIWIAVILGFIMALPIICMYIKIHNIFPDKNLFEIVEVCFGKIIGTIIILLYISYAYIIAAVILREYLEFYVTVTMQQTPGIVPASIQALLAAWLVKKGIELIGRWSELFAYILIAFVFITVVLLIAGCDIEINNLRPTMAYGIKPIIRGAFSVFSFPLTQVVVLTMVFSNLKNAHSYFKVYTLGTIIGFILIFLVFVANVAVLGVEQAANKYYTLTVTAARVDIGHFIQRTEIIANTMFLLGGVLKLSIFILAICKGISYIFRCIDYRFLVIPVTLNVINLNVFIFTDIVDMVEWLNDIIDYYHLFFHVFIPVIIWIACEIKNKKNLEL
ncbi:GerAB/ArcD/ProY family transporter [Tepidibacter hydrothermalis]|uniref:Endospore germination permease n=1 Tax=Tepidibacter hydrothermalis TaxID=3036126 RepID=A0ABY8EFS9_9FIRM|nr:endospore germination permease [Tepidibacter hydrothermalis]WFD09598.1 endospore germination permease [Tepidibacter hydrothermalis]